MCIYYCILSDRIKKKKGRRVEAKIISAGQILPSWILLLEILDVKIKRKLFQEEDILVVLFPT